MPDSETTNNSTFQTTKKYSPVSTHSPDTPTKQSSNEVNNLHPTRSNHLNLQQTMPISNSTGNIAEIYSDDESLTSKHTLLQLTPIATTQIHRHQIRRSSCTSLQSRHRSKRNRQNDDRPYERTSRPWQ